DRGQPAFATGPHADRIEFQSGHAVVVDQLPELRQLLHQRRNDFLGGADVAQRVGDYEGLQSGQRFERHLRDLALIDLLDVDTPAMGKRHRRRAVMRRISDREIDLVLGGDTALESDSVRLGPRVAVLVFDEVKPLLLFERGLEVARAADQAGLALLADAAAKYRLYENELMAVDEALDLLLCSLRSEHFGCGKVHVLEQRRTIKHSGNVHDSLP